MLPLGVIVAGGTAERMNGADKPLLSFRGEALVAHVIARVQPQLSGLALNVRANCADDYTGKGWELPLLFDMFDGRVGPLGGVLAGLDWAAAESPDGWLATFPADTPFLPHDLVPRLARTTTEGVPVVARTGKRRHSLCALWPLACRERLRKGVEDGRYRSLWWTLDDMDARDCTFEDENAFFNVNTAEDLAEADRFRSNV